MTDFADRLPDTEQDRQYIYDGLRFSVAFHEEQYNTTMEDKKKQTGESTSKEKKRKLNEDNTQQSNKKQKTSAKSKPLDPQQKSTTSVTPAVKKKSKGGPKIIRKKVPRKNKPIPQISLPDGFYAGPFILPPKIEQPIKEYPIEDKLPIVQSSAKLKTSQNGHPEGHVPETKDMSASNQNRHNGPKVNLGDGYNGFSTLKNDKKSEISGGSAHNHRSSETTSAVTHGSNHLQNSHNPARKRLNFN